jgi:hypothetical protein
MKWKYALCFLLLGMISCSGLIRNYGLINPSAVITNEFESFRINPELNYYISGSDLHPNAILGLREDLQLDPRTLWKRVVMTPTKMKELVGDMKTKVSEFGLSLYLYGFELITPDGRPVGVWYSIPTARTLLRMNEDNTIWIETPDIDTYEKFEVEPRED